MHSKKELIQTARMIAKESAEVEKMARKVAEACTDKRMKRVGSNPTCSPPCKWLYMFTTL